MTARTVDVDHVAGALALASWPAQAGITAARLACLARDVLDRQFGGVELARPILVGPVAVSVTTAGAGLAARMLQLLQERAAEDDTVEGQVLLATGGAGVAIPAIVGGKPCVVVHVRGGRAVVLR